MTDLLIGDDLYRAMDGFLECQDGIEQRLTRRYLTGSRRCMTEPYRVMHGLPENPQNDSMLPLKGLFSVFLLEDSPKKGGLW